MARKRSRLRSGRFGRRLAIAFALVAILTALLAGAIVTLVWATQFDNYVRENLRLTAGNAAELLARRYAIIGQWNEQSFAQLPQYGVMSGFALQVINPDGEPIYDDSALGARLYGLRVGGGAEGMRQQDTPVVTVPIRVAGELVGYVRVWSFGTGSLLTENDLQFRRSVLYGLAAAALIAVALASGAGLLYASSLVRPIERITDTADALRAGRRTARTGMRGQDEIGMLGKTFDEMADAIEADRELERRLTADVAHELRTPLQAIQATVEAMQDGVLPMDAERLSIVRDETVRLSRLAAGILELTRLERGATPMRMSRVDLANPARAAVDSHRALFESCELVLSLDVADGVWIQGDPDRLQQAIGNLLSNAARYTPKGGRVVVAVRADGDEAVAEVTDSGIGIEPDDMQRVFQRFWRADEARDRASGGLGIGLAVVKEIVDRHKGSVGAVRRSEGGTTFTLRFPLANRTLT